MDLVKKREETKEEDVKFWQLFLDGDKEYNLK
jgi:hypothetical protein